jgi:N-methylhydantoinase B
MTGTVVHRAGIGRASGAADADPILTEVIRHGLNSAAMQMKRALIRVSFSPIVYETMDFSTVLYDKHFRLLAQAPTLPFFMGAMSFCVESSVEAVGGVEALDEGDLILVNDPYMTGAHPQDAAIVMPVYVDDGRELVGFAAVKAHWLDVGAKAPYCTDTTDIFQEGTIFPGVKIHRAGEPVVDMLRMARANSRMPDVVDGDIQAQIVCLRTGAAELQRLVARHGLDRFWEAVERMYDHGEALVRAFIERIPDGRYAGHGVMDSDGLTEDEIPFDVVLEVDGSTARLDFSGAPPAAAGPVNCPLPSTISGARVIMTMLAGGGDQPNEGHFRPIEVVTRPGTLFHALRPSPCFLYGWPAMQATDALLEAVADAVPDRVVACSGGDICHILFWGTRRATGTFWADGTVYPIGQGASERADGISCIHHIESAVHSSSVEVWETKNPSRVRFYELRPDSGGPGRRRGGLGSRIRYEFLEPAACTSTVERTKNAPWGLAGGGAGLPNGVVHETPDGARTAISKATGLALAPGSAIEIHCGGGGGYGPAAERDPAAVLADVAAGYLTEPHAREHYPHAFPS